MKNAKGFTLIELLAVIVILAIIALITTPTILNVLEDSRKNAAVDKAWGTIEAVKTAYAQAQISDEVGVPYTVNFTETKATTSDHKAVSETGGGYATNYVGKTPVTASGDMPTSGFVTILSDGTLVAYNLTYGNYHCSTIAKEKDTSFNANKMVCSRTAGDVTAVTTTNYKVG